MTWHPDKFYTDAGKHDAEQKLKKINHARDVLKDHFAYGGHNVSGTCSCGAEGGQQYAQAPPGAGSSGPSPERSNSTRSAEPKNERPDNDTDNSRRRPDEQATHKAEQQAKAAHEQKTQNVFRREATQKDQPMRRKVSLGCAAMFVLLWIAVFISDGLGQFILSVEKSLFASKADAEHTNRLQEEWRTYQIEKARVAYTLLRRDPLSGEVAQWTSSFAASNREACWLSRLAYQQFVTPAEVEKKRIAQDLSDSRMDVERYQKYISFARTKLADAAMKLSDPSITGRDRAFAASDQATQLKFLKEGQTNLKYAQQHLDELLGSVTGVATMQPAPESVSPTSPGKSQLENIDMARIIVSSGRTTYGSGGHD